MTLQAKLDKIKEGGKARIPPERFAVMQAETDKLRASGIMDAVIQPGTKLPPFALNNQQGVEIRSEDLLARGAIVLTVFRGHW